MSRVRERLRLCRADGLIGREIRQCRAYATRDGYCWVHHLYVHGLELWGEHSWHPGHVRNKSSLCAPVPPGVFGPETSPASAPERAA